MCVTRVMTSAKGSPSWMEPRPLISASHWAKLDAASCTWGGDRERRERRRKGEKGCVLGPRPLTTPPHCPTCPPTQSFFYDVKGKTINAAAAACVSYFPLEKRGRLEGEEEGGENSLGGDPLHSFPARWVIRSPNYSCRVTSPRVEDGEAASPLQ